MKRTLLDLTQSILSSLDSDEVNSISDTTEAQQIAEIIRNTYFNIQGRTNLPKHDEIFQLTASGDVNQPVLMFKPDNIGKMEWLKYFDATATKNVYNYVTILPNEQFIDMVDSFNTEETDVESFSFSLDGTTFPFYYKTNKQPQYCTVIQNYYVIFDGHDITLDATLQSTKTMGYGEKIPVFTMTDNFIPDLDDKQFALLLNEAKSLAYFELKQTAHPKAEQEAKRQWSSVQRDKSLVDKPSYFDQLPNFGR